jgi:hypothetical protein
MCTVSWIYSPEGYQLFFNRDEKLTRRKAAPPSLAVSEAVQFLAPVDGDFGGTWIACNELGVTLCLLNGANLTGSSGAEPKCPQSRGAIVPALIGVSSVAEICERFRHTELMTFAPFTIAALGPHRPAALCEWDGSKKTQIFCEDSLFMLTSSSFDTEAVRAARRQEFRGGVLSSERVSPSALADFHRSHRPARSAYSICMHRPDAETVSFSHIQVNAQAVDFFYVPGAPCEGVSGVSLSQVRRMSKLSGNPNEGGRFRL